MTKKIRVAVACDYLGNYNAAGWGGPSLDSPDAEALWTSAAMEGLEPSGLDGLVWIEAEIPLPTEQTVAGTAVLEPAAQPPAEAQPVTGRLGLLALALALVGLLAGCASAPEPVAAPPLTSICLCGSIVHADGTRNDSFQSCFTSEVSFSDLRSITLHLCTADDLTKVLP